MYECICNTTPAGNGFYICMACVHELALNLVAMSGYDDVDETMEKIIDGMMGV